MSTQSLIQGIPFKFGNDVRIEGNTDVPEVDGLSLIVNKIKNFDWDSYEYSFKLEKDVLDEYAAKLEVSMLQTNDTEDS